MPVAVNVGDDGAEESKRVWDSRLNGEGPVAVAQKHQVDLASSIDGGYDQVLLSILIKIATDDQAQVGGCCHRGGDGSAEVPGSVVEKNGDGVGIEIGDGDVDLTVAVVIGEYNAAS